MSIISRNTLNPADITVLFRIYLTTHPPPIDLIQNPPFLDLLVDSLFKTIVLKSILNIRANTFICWHMRQVCVWDFHKKVNKRNINEEKLKRTIRAIEKEHGICIVNLG